MLDPDSPLPLYYQLKTYLSKQVKSGIWKPGDRLPSESDLGVQFGISRTTIRQAIGDMVNEGLLNRIHGVGTFVALPRIEKRMTMLTGFTQDMFSRGLAPSSKVLRREIHSASAQIARNLGIPEGESTVYFERLRLADQEPMGVDIIDLPLNRFPGLYDEDLGGNVSLYNLLTNRYGTQPARSSARVSAIGCPAEYAAALSLRRGSPVLQIIRTTFDQNDQPFEQVLALYRGDRYVYNIALFV